MAMRRAIVAGIVLAAMMGLSGCKKKKPPIPPPQAQAPTITPETQPAPQPPAPAAEPNRPQPEAAPPPAEPTTTTTKPKVKKPRPSTAAAKKTPPPASQPEKPSRTVVEQGGTQPAGAQLSASIPPDEAIHQKFTTAQLLQSADSNLKAISRPLNADEQATVQHIRSLMQQSRDATKDGDSDRAYNLAWKAHLLVDELIKR